MGTTGVAASQYTPALAQLNNEFCKRLKNARKQNRAQKKKNKNKKLEETYNQE